MEALNTLLLLLTALAIPGLINRTRARLAGRKGIRFAQHLYDVALLLRKGAVYSTTTSALFRIAPSVSLGSALVAALFIPVGDLQPDERGEVAETLGDREVDERHDIEDDERKDHCTTMFRRSR